MRLLALLLILFVGVLLSKPTAAAEPARIKAAFVINFAKFTRWPADQPQSITICFPTVAEPVGAAMVRHYGSLQISGQPLIIRRGLEKDELRFCHIIYLGAEDKYRQAYILHQLGNTAILTISDLPDFNHAGGMIELFPEKKKYRFTINQAAISQAGLAINARILGLARPQRTRPIP